jgi:hypothetical protein
LSSGVSVLVCVVPGPDLNGPLADEARLDGCQLCGSTTRGRERYHSSRAE